MKRLPGFVLVAFLLLTAASAFTQEAVEPGEFGVFVTTGLGWEEAYMKASAIETDYVDYQFDLKAIRHYGIGFAWRVTEDFELRPSVFFGSISTEEEDVQNDEEAGEWSITLMGTTLGGYYTALQRGGLLFYVGPRIEYQRVSAEYEDGDVEQSGVGSRFAILGIGGLTYLFSPQFGVFADAGLGISFNKVKDEDKFAGTTTSEAEFTSTEFSLARSNLGVIFYF
ncbi:MAG: hypothetical protein ACLFPV_15515 [Spirochaetaceae bacterium]